jgi:peptidyl-prolyl cis-trans isomerase C
MKSNRLDSFETKVPQSAPARFPGAGMAGMFRLWPVRYRQDSAPIPADTDILATYRGGVGFHGRSGQVVLLVRRPGRPAHSDADVNETKWVETAVRNIVLERLVAEEAIAAGLDQTEDLIKKRKEYTNDAITRLFYRRELADLVSVSDREIETYFNEHRSDYETPATVSFHMMFFDAQKEGRDKALRRALRGLARVARGAEFNSLIVENSDIEEHERSKEFGPYRPGEGLLPAVEEEALKLQVGQTSRVIEHKRGFHIIKLTRKTEKVEPRIDDYRDRIYRLLFKEKLYEAERDYIAQVKPQLEIRENFDIMVLPITSTNDIILRVNDETLTYGQYLELAKSGNYQTPEEVQQAFLRRYNDMIYLVMARQKGYDKDSAVQEWVEIQMRRELTLAYLESEIDKRVTIPEEEIRHTYEENKTLYYEPQMVFARQIYIPIATREGMTRHELIQEIGNSRAQALAIIADLQEGLSFEEAARQYSAAPNADKGGILGWVMFGSSPRFDNAVFALAEGEITLEPVAGKRGYQIVKVEKKEPASLMPYEVAWKQIHDRLHAIEADQLRARHIQEVTEKAEIESRPAMQRQFSRYFNDFAARPNIYSVFD